MFQTVRSILAKKVTSDAIWVFFGQLVSVLSVVVGLRLLTEYLSPEEFGLLSLLVGMSAFVLGFASNPVLQSSMRYQVEYSAVGLGRTIRSVTIGLYRRFIAFGMLIVAIVAFFLARGVSASFLLSALLVGLLLADSIRAYETAMLNAARRQKLMAVWHATDAFVRPFLAVAFLIFFGGGATQVLLMYVIAGLVVNVAFTKTIRLESAGGRHDQSAAPEIRARIVRYMIPLVPIGILAWINGLGDRYLIAGLLTLGDAGLYAASYGLVSRPFLTLGSALDILLRPMLYDALTARNTRLFAIVVACWVLIVLSASVILISIFSFLGGSIASIFLASEYAFASKLFFWISLGYSFVLLSQMFGRICHAYEATYFLLFAHLISSAAAIVFVIFGIKNFGLIGAAMAVPAYFAVQLFGTACCAWLCYNRPYSPDL